MCLFMQTKQYQIMIFITTINTNNYIRIKIKPERNPNKKGIGTEKKNREENNSKSKISRYAFS